MRKNPPNNPRRSLWYLLTVVALCGWSAVPARAQVGDEPLDQRRRRVRAMPAVEFDRLRRNHRQFDSLPSAEQDRLRRLYEQIENHPDGPQLREVMEHYYQWVRRLSPAAREELLSTPPAERLAKVRELRRRQPRGRPRFGAPPWGRRREGGPPPFQRPRRVEDLVERSRWIEHLVEGKLTDQERSELQSKQGMARLRALLDHVRGLELLAGPKPLGPEKLADEQLREIAGRIDQGPPGLTDLPPSTQREVLGWRLRLWALTLTPPDEQLPSVPEDELQEFFTEEVQQHKLATDYFDRRPGRFKRDLTILYFDVYPEKRRQRESP